MTTSWASFYANQTARRSNTFARTRSWSFAAHHRGTVVSHSSFVASCSLEINTTNGSMNSSLHKRRIFGNHLTPESPSAWLNRRLIQSRFYCGDEVDNIVASHGPRFGTVRLPINAIYKYYSFFRGHKCLEGTNDPARGLKIALF